MAKTFLVLGAESSGTKLATEILIHGGVSGDAGDVQRWDTEPFPAPVDHCDLVWRRSMPHAGAWIDPAQLVTRAVAAGYDLRVIVTVRETVAMANSQVRRGHVFSIADAERNIQQAYIYIFQYLYTDRINYYILPYEALILHTSFAIAGLYKWAELPQMATIPNVYDGDLPHYRAAGKA